MSNTYSVVDGSGRYLANVIAKRGRNEIQFYPLTGSSHGPVDETQVTRHELQTDSDIADVAWINDSAVPVTPSKKSAKKRSASAILAAESATSSPKTPQTPFSPQQKRPQWPKWPKWSARLAKWLLHSIVVPASVSVPEPPISLAATTNDNSVWMLGASGSICSVNVIDGEITKSIRFGRIDPDVCVIAECKYKTKKRRNCPDTEELFVASSRLHLIDGAKCRGYQIAEFFDPEDDEETNKAPIASIVTATTDGSIIVTNRDDSSVLQLYDVADPSQNPVLLQCKSSDIHSVRTLKDEYVVAFTSKGAELFAIKDEISTKPVACIQPRLSRVSFENLYWSNQHGVVGVWYDGNQPRFTPISEDLAFDGHYKIPISVKPTVPSDEPEEDTVADITFTAENGADVTITNIPATNDNEENIKSTIRQFASSEHCASLVENLFEVISARVAEDPSRKTSLSVWLRWILLAHGGHISKQKRFADNLHALQSSLEDGMDLMSKLLALQGRLQLLKAQAELRNSVANGDNAFGADVEADEQERELDALNDTFNTTANIEESVIYANGENDDFEDALSTQADTAKDDISYENGEEDTVDEDVTASTK
ncbi:hypothetical protein JCM33374_g2645 [Metschnikowia sp. JCM 33374]|nr:hypothetical protein JCM33374_g2645 [Metschnikowia sp. JCM 33374]